MWFLTGPEIQPFHPGKSQVRMGSPRVKRHHRGEREESEGQTNQPIGYLHKLGCYSPFREILRNLGSRRMLTKEKT